MKKIVLSMILALGMSSVAMANEAQVENETSAPIEVKQAGDDCDKYKDTKGYKPSYCEDANQTQEPVKEGPYKPLSE